jgi:hypothetical protein
MKFCAACGAQNRAEAVFCAQCGFAAKPTQNSTATTSASKNEVDLSKLPPPGAPAPATAPVGADQSSNVKAMPAPTGAPIGGAPTKPSIPTQPVAPKAAPAPKPAPTPIPKPVKPPKPPKPPRKPLSKKTKRILAAIPVLAVIGVGLAVAPWPRAVQVDLAVNASYGGVFADGCAMTAEGKALGGSEITFVPAGGDPTTGSKAGLSFEAVGTDCHAKATIFVPRDQAFDLYVGSTLVNSLSAAQAESGSFAGLVDLRVSRTITGTITVVDHYQSCQKVSAGIDCTVPSSAIVSSDLHKNVMSCQGSAGYSDVKKGSTVLISNRSTKVSTNAKLSAGKATISDSDLKSGRIVCTFDYAITVPNDVTGYVVSVGGHKKVNLDVAKLAANDWAASAQIN